MDESRYILTTNEIFMALTAMESAAGGVPRTGEPAKLYKKLRYYYVELAKKNNSMIMRVYFMDRKKAKQGIGQKMDEKKVWIPEGENPKRFCPIYPECEKRHGDCIRTKDGCPEKITEEEVQKYIAKNNEGNSWLDKELEDMLG